MCEPAGAPVNGWLQFLATVLAVGGSILTTWLVVGQTGKKNKTDAAQALFNEVQEERAELKQERTELRGRIERIEAENRARDERERIRDDYIQELRDHIRRGLPPPPPEWPAGLHRHHG